MMWFTICIQGTGTIAQYIAKKAKYVIGIESVQEAIDAVQKNILNSMVWIIASFIVVI